MISPRTLLKENLPALKATATQVRELPARELLLIALLVATVLTPPVTVISGLPDLRIEQGLIVLIVAWLAWKGVRNNLLLRFGLLDVLFLALAASTVLSIAWGKFALGVPVIRRDFYELLKILEYALLFRFASSIGELSSPVIRRTVLALILAGMASALVSIFQYFNFFRVNDWLSPVYAPEHHLRALENSGRVVGTLGNPNDYGIFAGVIALTAIAWFIFGAPSRRQSRLLMVALAAAVFTLIMTLSRSATFGGIAALLWMGVLAVSKRQLWPRLLVAYVALALMVGGSLGVLQAFPKTGGNFIQRFASALEPTGDRTFAMRLLRWRDILAGDQGKPDFDAPMGLTAAVRDTGIAAAAPDVLQRDGDRKRDLQVILEVLRRYKRDHGSYPLEGDFPQGLIPRYLFRLPEDPRGQPYRYFSTGPAFSLGAPLENAADPDYPVYGLGSVPNLLRNSSLEDTDSQRADEWLTLGPKDYQITDEEALYDVRSALYEAAEPVDKGGLYQIIYVGAPAGVTLTAAFSAYLEQYHQGEFSLYVVAIFTDGEIRDPIVKASLDTSRLHQWQRVTVSFSTDPQKALGFMRVYALGQNFQGKVRLDGFQLTAGDIPLSYSRLREGRASDALWGLDVKSFRDSPVVGVGPQKAFAAAAVDNEYLLYGTRYGLLGLSLYMLLYLLPFLAAFVVFRKLDMGPLLALAVALQAVVVAFLLFNVSAGTFYRLQVMALFWLLAGFLVGSGAAYLKWLKEPLSLRRKP